MYNIKQNRSPLLGSVVIHEAPSLNDFEYAT